MAEKSRVTTPRGRHESWCQASAVRGCVPILINPEFDAALDRDSCVTHWMSSPGSALWYMYTQSLTSDNLFFLFFLFFLLCRFVSVVWQEQWQSAECDTRYVVQRKKFDVILGFLVVRYRRTKPPKPDASQFVVPARLPKPAIGSGGLSSSRFDDDVPEVNFTWTASFSWRVKEAALWFESYRAGSKNLTGGTTWSSQSTSTDWLTRTHHWGSPRSKLAYKKPASTRKLRKFPVTSGQGSKHRAWLDCVTMMSEMTIAVIVVSASSWSCHHLTRADSGWSRISWFSRVTLPWLRGGTSVAPWRHKSSHVPVFRRLFDRLPVRISTSDLHHRILRKKIYHIRAYDFGVQFSFNSTSFFCNQFKFPGCHVFHIHNSFLKSCLEKSRFHTVHQVLSFTVHDWVPVTVIRTVLRFLSCVKHKWFGSLQYMYNANLFWSYCCRKYILLQEVHVRPASTMPRQEDQQQEEPRLRVEDELVWLERIEEGKGRGFILIWKGCAVSEIISVIIHLHYD